MEIPVEQTVSIVIASYNADAYLKRCLDSLLSQTYPNLEIIVIDDGSTDGTANILDTYQRENGDRLVIVHQANQGAAKARNKGIGIARGELLTFVDADDYLDRDFLETYVRAQRDADADVVCGGYRRPDANGSIVNEMSIDPNTEWAPYAMTAGCAKLYRTSYIHDGGFRFLPVDIGEDLFFTIPAIASAATVHTLSYVGYNYYFNTGSASNTKLTVSRTSQFVSTLDLITDDLTDRGVSLDGLVLHVFVRSAAWFLLNTARDSSDDYLHNSTNQFVSWLDRRIPNWRDDGYATPRRPTGDALANRLAVWLFVRHPRLFSVALKLYGKVGRS
jgi:glycosyltransferase involved in cell wall biosynthesis